MKIGLELLIVGLLYFRVVKQQISKRVFISVLIANIASYLIIFLVILLTGVYIPLSDPRHFGIFLNVYELFMGVGVEGLLIYLFNKRTISLGRALILSLIMNILTFSMIINAVLMFLGFVGIFLVSGIT